MEKCIELRQWKSQFVIKKYYIFGALCVEVCLVPSAFSTFKMVSSLVRHFERREGMDHVFFFFLDGERG